MTLVTPRNHTGSFRVGLYDFRTCRFDLVQQYQKNGKAKVSLAAWKNVSKDGESYLTLTGKLPKPIEKTIVTE
jgi:hypothetical protein